MMTAEEAREQSESGSDLEKIKNRIKEKVQFAVDRKERECSFDMTEYQDYTDDVIDWLEELKYKANYNRPALTMEINW